LETEKNSKKNGEWTGLVSNAAFSADYFVGVVGAESRITHYRTCGTAVSGPTCAAISRIDSKRLEIFE
jgi:hypothetical protein